MDGPIQLTATADGGQITPGESRSRTSDHSPIRPATGNVPLWRTKSVAAQGVSVCRRLPVHPNI